MRDKTSDKICYHPQIRCITSSGGNTSPKPRFQPKNGLNKDMLFPFLGVISKMCIPTQFMVKYQNLQDPESLEMLQGEGLHDMWI